MYVKNYHCEHATTWQKKAFTPDNSHCLWEEMGFDSLAYS